ncbi:divergent polysaccharide deacetylase family protein [Sulfitobacter donghicola]|uniref:Polysaccharide deacetylase n=1 Tax=Sulfitobacter donghicola DSW-25 = KCTC 12864 = JCM 14565 TaxID=1300350 RepID=A0A073IIB8_9RHOB|nr:divergent polysaccharide deacetylase family protein [Sulfitobacter donghicola]KEJ89504.1 hypothetical protein DSW25_10895 [Sulfitobacter donghicola DSW-25 = KCTC 12864 = JCM 14565]KIN69327.1 YibQ protein [Sulfitobacter donghicola DSW-25 = KCTC 12864 = JCM 14565]
MAQGILSGIGLGAIFSVGVAGVVSVLVPIEPQAAPELGIAETVAEPEQVTPQASVTVSGESDSAVQQPQISLRTPAGEDLPKEPVAAALAPEVASDLETAVADLPVASAPVTAPAVETAALTPQPSALSSVDSDVTDHVVNVPSPLPQPQTGAVDNLTVPRPLPGGVVAHLEEEAPVLTNPQALAPMIPDDSADGVLADRLISGEAAPVQPVLQAQEQEQTLEAAQEGEEILVVVPPAPAPDQQEDTEVASAPKPRVVQTPGTQVAALGSASGRPTIGTPASTLINRSAQAEETQVLVQRSSSAATSQDETPLRNYAQPFENPEGKPLMSIVLMDNGVDLEANEIGLPALSRFPYPVSFAVDVRLLDAAKRMERYRAEGFDVLAMVDLPQGAQPTDAEVSLNVALNGLPEIVGVLEGTGEGLQNSRAVADQVTGILKASGHGLVTQSKGLNSMPKLAVKEGVPAAPVFRDFDSAGQNARVIRRFLDQAAFKAGQEGGVIMLGRLRAETIEALLVWGLADRAGSVALAPVSAVLLAQ